MAVRGGSDVTARLAHLTGSPWLPLMALLPFVAAWTLLALRWMSLTPWGQGLLTPWIKSACFNVAECDNERPVTYFSDGAFVWLADWEGHANGSIELVHQIVSGDEERAGGGLSLERVGHEGESVAGWDDDRSLPL